jgi:hypothetical protein
MGKCVHTTNSVTGVHTFTYSASAQSEVLRFKDWIIKNCKGFKVVTKPTWSGRTGAWSVKAHFIHQKWAVLAKLGWVE